MDNRIIFLKLFIDSFYVKSVKRRTPNNQAHWIVKTINDTCKNHFNKRLKFTEDEILEAFNSEGYTIMLSGDEEFTWDRFHNNDIRISNDKFINIKSQNNTDLRNSWRSNKSNYSKEIIDRLDNLRDNVSKFWDENSYLV